MRKAYIKAIEYYLPEKTLSNEEISRRFPEWSSEKVAKKVGISVRHIAASNETALDLACKAGEKLLATNPGLKNEIDFVLLCSQSVDYKLPSSACLLQNRLGLSTNCGAFDFNLGCSGYEYGLAVAKGFIVSGVANNILLVTAETYSKYIHPSDKGNLTIFGDAASASLISTEGFAEIGQFVLGSDGSGAEKLIVKTGGARIPESNGLTVCDDNGNERRDDYLFMDGGAIFDFSSETVPSMIESLLVKENVSKDEIDLWVFHQANKYMINYLRKLMDIDSEKFFVYMENVGNTVSSTIPIALKEAMLQGRLNGNVVLAGFGVGLSWGATMLKVK